VDRGGRPFAVIDPHHDGVADVKTGSVGVIRAFLTWYIAASAAASSAAESLPEVRVSA